MKKIANDGTKKKAKLFIGYILQSIPNLQSIYIPSAKFEGALGMISKLRGIDIFLPKDDKETGLPYKKIAISSV